MYMKMLDNKSNRKICDELITGAIFDFILSIISTYFKNFSFIVFNQYWSQESPCFNSAKSDQFYLNVL